MPWELAQKTLMAQGLGEGRVGREVDIILVKVTGDRKWQSMSKRMKKTSHPHLQQAVPDSSQSQWIEAPNCQLACSMARLMVIFC